MTTRRADAGYVNLPEALTKSDDYYFYNLGVSLRRPVPPDGTGPSPSRTPRGLRRGRTDRDDLPVRPPVGSTAWRSARAPCRRSDGLSERTRGTVGDNIELAFGQGGTILTPIEQANAYATFANGGTRYAPQVASAVVDPTTGAVVKKITPVVTGHVNLPPSIRDPILQGLQGVITNGRRLRPSRASRSTLSPSPARRAPQATPGTSSPRPGSSLSGPCPTPSTWSWR